VGGAFVFGTPGDDTRDVQNSFIYGDISPSRGRHSLRGGEFAVTT
jgi:hypothetical protein